MSEHLPECRKPAHLKAGCICDRLRACEQRVRTEDDDYAYVAAQAKADGRRRGWAEALDAAREAVAELHRINDALAAIDALREGKR